MTKPAWLNSNNQDSPWYDMSFGNNYNNTSMGGGGGWTPPGGLGGMNQSDTDRYFALQSRRLDQQDQMLNNQGFGMNMNTFNAGIGGLSALSNMYNGYQANKMAKEQFKFNKGVTNTNLMNQIQSYNTALKDRINARSHMQGDSQEKTDKYIQENSLKRHK